MVSLHTCREFQNVEALVRDSGAQFQFRLPILELLRSRLEVKSWPYCEIVCTDVEGLAKTGLASVGDSWTTELWSVCGGK